MTNVYDYYIADQLSTHMIFLLLQGNLLLKRNLCFVYYTLKPKCV